MFWWSRSGLCRTSTSSPFLNSKFRVSILRFLHCIPEVCSLKTEAVVDRKNVCDHLRDRIEDLKDPWRRRRRRPEEPWFRRCDFETQSLSQVIFTKVRLFQRSFWKIEPETKQCWEIEIWLWYLVNIDRRPWVKSFWGRFSRLWLAILPWNSFFRSKTTKRTNFGKLK